MTTKKLKKGDKVICINKSHVYFGKTDRVLSVPGNPEYDQVGFFCAEDGIVLKKNSWEWREDWKPVIK
jgi:hypothetical protein